MTDSNQNMQASDEITLKELILLIQEYWGVLWGKKWYIIIAGLIGGIILGFIEYRKPIVFNAELTFMVNEDESVGIAGGAAAILGQFGISTGSSSELNLDKLIELSKSLHICEKVLLDSFDKGNDKELIANEIINRYEFHENKWKDDSLLNNYLFSVKQAKKSSNLQFNKALKSVFSKLIGSKDEEGLIDLTYEEETNILKISVMSTNESLSYHICNSAYKHLSEFYVEKSIEKQKVTFEILTNKADSTLKLLKQAEYSLAKTMDNSNGFKMQVDQVDVERLKREVQILSISYAEIIKNLATSEFLLETSRPVFQLIDSPIFPIARSINRTKFKFIIGLIAMGLISTIVILFRFFLSKNLN